MKIAYLTCVHNEEDLIYYNLVYHYNLGIRRFFVGLHDSNEATRKQVKRFAKEVREAKCTFMDISGYDFDQAIVYTRMAMAVSDEGYEWVLPVDADELLVLAGESQILEDYLQKLPEGDYISLKRYDYHPHPDFKKRTRNLFLKWINREAKPNGIYDRCLVRWFRGCEFYGGTHFVRGAKAATKICSDLLFIAHFPFRNFEQYKKKALRIGLVKLCISDVCGQIPDAKLHPAALLYRAYLRFGDVVFKQRWVRIMKRRKEALKDSVVQPFRREQFQYKKEQFNIRVL
jgi:hypothetical protein